MQENALAAGAAPGPRTRTSYNAIPYPLAGGEGLAAPFQEPHSRSRPFRPRAFALHLLLWYDKDADWQSTFAVL